MDNKGFEFRHLTKQERQQIKKQREKVFTRIDIESVKSENASCPCKHIEPCNDRCSCVNPLSSVGCSRCCTCGSKEQQVKQAKRLANLPAENARLREAVEQAKTYLSSHGYCNDIERNKVIKILSKALNQKEG